MKIDNIKSEINASVFAAGLALTSLATGDSVDQRVRQTPEYHSPCENIPDVCSETGVYTCVVFVIDYGYGGEYRTVYDVGCLTTVKDNSYVVYEVSINQ